MSAIVFTLSEEASARVRAYCGAHGADLNGLASGAVRMLMDILDEDTEDPWSPEPDGMATGHDPGCAPSSETDWTKITWEQACNEADAVRTMLDLRAQGMTLRAIADELARLGRVPEVDIAEREIVAAVVKARAAGLSIREIAAELFAAGMRTGRVRK